MAKKTLYLQLCCVWAFSMKCLVALTPDFYDNTCPNLTSIVTHTVTSLASQSVIVAPSTLRLFFHDCMVQQGCDASILISSMPTNEAERDAPENLSLAPQAFNTIIAAKTAVEEACPGTVSCADILALAARDVVVFTGGPNWDVPLGRRDGLQSTAASASTRLPGSHFNVPQLLQSFASVGLDMVDLVALSGGHTIGFTHCNQFTDRLYNFSSSESTDPSLNPSYAQSLQQQCPLSNGDPTVVCPFDPTTPFQFDNAYFKNLQNGEGLLYSDEVLFMDPSAAQIVDQFAASQDSFFLNFIDSMIRVSSVGVLEGTLGEIRKDCTAFNSN